MSNRFAFDVARRAYDGAHVVWWFGPVPDEHLDNNPQALRDYLRRTKGWRARAWQPVFVGSEQECQSYVSRINN